MQKYLQKRTLKKNGRQKRQRQKQKQGRKDTAHSVAVVEEQDRNTIDNDQASATFSSDDSTGDSTGVNGFAALLLGDDSDSE